MKVNILRTDNVKCDGKSEGWGDAFRYFPRLASLYAFTLFYDPFWLGTFDEPPQVNELFSDSDPCYGLNPSDLLVMPHSFGKDEVPRAFFDFVNNGGRALLVRPGKDIREKIEPLHLLKWKGDKLSNREKWRFGPNPDKFYQYPQHLRFDMVHVPQKKEVIPLARLGEWPDGLSFDNIVYFTSDIIHAFELFRQVPTENTSRGFTNDFLNLFLQACLKLTGKSGIEEVIEKATPYFDLRRDFHSFGFAKSMVEDLARELGEKVDLSREDYRVWKAARSICEGEGQEREARDSLKEAFGGLKRKSKELAPVKKYILDGLHGGILFPDYGFAEYDYPTSAHEWIDFWLRFVDEKKYAFNLQIGGSTHEEDARCFPKFYDKLKRYWEEGKIEIVDGTYGQPYPQFFPLESFIQQLKNGQEVIRSVFGKNAQSYVRQEFGFLPQLPVLLRDFGYRRVSHRTQNWGSTPCEKAGKIVWKGKEGSEIEALPSHIPKSEHHPIDFFPRLPSFIASSYKHGYEYGVYTNLLDSFWHPVFREETIRTTRYAPVLGEFTTYGDFFSKTGKPKKVSEYQLSDYKYRSFSEYLWAGTIISTFNFCLIAEEKIEMGEKIASILCLLGEGEEVFDGKFLNRCWKSLNAYQNHDSICVPLTNVGGHTRSYTGLLGPFREETVEEVGRKKLEKDLSSLKDMCKRGLKKLGSKIGLGKEQYEGTFLVFNPCSFKREVSVKLEMDVPDGEAYAGNKKLPSQKVEEGILTKVEVPSFGYKVVGVFSGERKGRKKSKEKAREGLSLNPEKPVISNDHLEVALNPRRGSLERIVLLSGDEVLSKKANLLVFGEGSQMECDNWCLERGPVRERLFAKGKVFDTSKEEVVANYETRVELFCGEKKVHFKTKLIPGDIPFGDQWVLSVRARFETELENPTINRLYHNVVEEVKEEKFTSLYGLFFEDEEKDRCIALYNRGNQHYIWDGKSVDNVLIHSRERARVFQYCLEVGEKKNKYKRTLDYQIRPVCEKVEPGQGTLKEEESFLKIKGSESVIASSVRTISQGILLRLMETEGKDCDVELTLNFSLQEVNRVNLNGEKIGEVNFEGEKIKLALNPWEIVSLKIEK